MRLRTAILSLALVMLAGMCQTVLAANLCVNRSDRGDCYPTIQQAVDAAAPGDVIHVSPGTYNEDVTITVPLSLIGQNQKGTIIDAGGLKPGEIIGPGDGRGGINAKIALVNGITIVNANDVVISGFTVENAVAAGIKVIGSTTYPASHILISNNTVKDNDTAGQGTCGVEPLETTDCGEGVFLSGVDHSVVVDNTVTRNAGGILVTDDTGPNHDNLITENSIVHNHGGDCGITLPSHSGMGVYHNTVSHNDSSYNTGPGVGMFAPFGNTATYGNLVIDNTMHADLTGGIDMHNHIPFCLPGAVSCTPPVFNDNKIIGNDISDNTADTGTAVPTPGPVGINVYSVSPMTGTVISQNKVFHESYDIVINVPAQMSGSEPPVEVHLNDLEPHGAGNVGIDDNGQGSVDAMLNWWGCSTGPETGLCSGVLGLVNFTPWLTNPVADEPPGFGQSGR